MDFATIGNVRSYAKMVNLKFAAKYRLRTGQSLVNSNGTLNFSTLGKSSSFVDKMMSAQKQTADAATKKRLAAIKKKLLNGKKLSNEEMGFLLKNDSKLYNKAKKAEEAREELKAALGRAKTKKEAREALMHAMMKASAECSAELDAAKSRGGGGSAGGMSGFSGGGDMGMGIAISGDGGGVIDGGSVGLEGGSVGLEGGSISSEGDASLENVSTNEAGAAENTSAVNGTSDQNTSEDGQTSALGNTSSTDNDKMTKDDILEKFLMIIRALEDEWAQFSKSKQYRELPEEYDDVQKLGRKKSTWSDYKAIDVASMYRAAMSLSILED